FRARYNKLTFLNRPLRNKWAIHNILSKDSRFSSYLPKTRFIESMQDVSDMLRHYPLLYLKPINGTGGRGILRIQRGRNNLLLVQGRNQSRQIIRPQQMKISSLNSYLAHWNL